MLIFFQNLYNNTPLYLHCHYALSPEDRLKKYRLVQKIYAKITSSPQNVNFSQIFNFQVNLTPIEPVDIAQRGLKSLVLFMGIKYVEIKKSY